MEEYGEVEGCCGIHPVAAVAVAGVPSPAGSAGAYRDCRGVIVLRVQPCSSARTEVPAAFAGVEGETNAEEEEGLDSRAREDDAGLMGDL